MPARALYRPSSRSVWRSNRVPRRTADPTGPVSSPNQLYDSGLLYIRPNVLPVQRLPGRSIGKIRLKFSLIIPPIRPDFIPRVGKLPNTPTPAVIYLRVCLLEFGSRVIDTSRYFQHGSCECSSRKEKKTYMSYSNIDKIAPIYTRVHLRRIMSKTNISVENRWVAR